VPFNPPSDLTRYCIWTVAAIAVLFRKAPGEPQKRRRRKQHSTDESFFATKDAHAASRNFAKKKNRKKLVEEIGFSNAISRRVQSALVTSSEPCSIGGFFGIFLLIFWVIYEAGSAKYHDHLMTVVSGGE
jgi:hypothetical protein